MESQIRYLAIVSEQPGSAGRFLLPLFYDARAWPFRRPAISRSPMAFTISRSLKPRNDSDRTGISHFGITIDDIEDSRRPH